MTKYNGWTNYETWLVGLWFSDSYNEYFLEQFREGDLLQHVNADEVRDYVVGWVDEEVPENGFVTDLLNNAMSQVNWRELAEHVEELLQYEMENA
jgi:hypothetical protein